MIESIVLSECEKYRYKLAMIWSDKPIVAWIMLNPAATDVYDSNPTIRRVIYFSKKFGYGGFVVVNLWAYRATKPKELLEFIKNKPVDLRNIESINEAINRKDVIVAWGNNVTDCDTVRLIKMNLMRANSVNCLGYTKSGQPKHPLRLERKTRRRAWKDE